MTERADREAIYEALRDQIERAEPALSAAERAVVWASETHNLGFARAQDARIEIFFVGEAIWSGRPAIARHLEHDSWSIRHGGTIGATRLLLPNEPHFDRVAAFICAEVMLSGVDDDVAGAFKRSEPIIELALEGAANDAVALSGLCGELLFLQSLTRLAPHLTTFLLMDAWAGHAPSSRDLQLGPIGVEVKTTSRGASEHHIQGPHQVELGVSVAGVQETGLFLMSIGLAWLPMHQTDAYSLPTLVRDLAGSLPPGERSQFLERVSGYAGVSGLEFGDIPGELPPELRRPFGLSFTRLYDLTDERIRLPRTDLLAEMDVVPESVNYRIRLPNEVNGTLNPIIGLAAAAQFVLDRMD